MSAPTKLVMTADEINAFFHEVFPQVRGDFSVDDVAPREITLRLKVGERHLRPGGTVSGPSMFGLADVTVYAMILSLIGPRALSVTTSSSFDFMRKPDGTRDMIAKGKLLKLGKSLAVGDVLLFSEGDTEPVARSTMTYSIPPAHIK